MSQRLIIDQADRKQLKRSQTHEGLRDQIKKKKNPVWAHWDLAYTTVKSVDF